MKRQPQKSVVLGSPFMFKGISRIYKKGIIIIINQANPKYDQNN